jgi:hypothetical protein
MSHASVLIEIQSQKLKKLIGKNWFIDKPNIYNNVYKKNSGVRQYRKIEYRAKMNGYKKIILNNHYF